MRRALRDVLPPRILRRNSKGSVDEALCRAVQREWNEFDHLSRWQVCERELVDPQRLRREVELMKLGLQAPTNRMVRVFSLERWLRSLSRVRHDLQVAAS